MQSSAYFNGKYFKKDKILFRQYQNNIVKRSLNKNSLIVLPTGLGKTIIAILMIGEVLKKYPDSQILILAPTRPLVSQHFKSCLNFFEIESHKITLFTGKVPPERRIQSFYETQILISTPQVIKNDLERGRYDLSKTSLIIFDEAHRAKGNYAYTFISSEYVKTCKDPIILGLTASPGKDLCSIQELCDNLFIENVVLKSYSDKDVSKYIYDIDSFLEYIDLPMEYLELSAVWYDLFEVYLRFFIDKKLIPPNKPYYSKLDFLGISKDLTISIQYENGALLDVSEKNFSQMLYYSEPKMIDLVKENDLNIESIFSYCASCISILHGKELLETQEISLFKSFINKIEAKAQKDILSAKRIVNSDHLKYIKKKLETDQFSCLHHPKIDKVISIIKEELEEYNNSKILIFTQYRNMAEKLKTYLESENSHDLVIEKFIGQTSKIDDDGFSQTRQMEIIDKFRRGSINVLIATSVAEEGLDIPNVDAIIFYEPIPSEIRLIQRRGRTGRHAPGRCYILITKSTTDVPFYAVARRKEQTMHSILTETNDLQLCSDLIRTPIDFKENLEDGVNETCFNNAQDRIAMEKQILVNRSIEEILSEYERFFNSEEYKRYRDSGVTLYSDLVEFDERKIQDALNKFKVKGRRKRSSNKIYLNKNVKTLINIVKLYSNQGRIKMSKLKQLAINEEIYEDKFYTHLNYACYLGHLKKIKDDVVLVMDFD